jgi:predicted DNA-binding transcriptional regulator YafY
MAKDSEKLIRELSLMLYLVTVGRPVAVAEVIQKIDAYGDLGPEAFHRRFCADRAELESLGIKVEGQKPNKGATEEATYTLLPKSFYLPAIDPTEEELRELHVVLSALGEDHPFALPVKLLLERLSWARPEAKPAERPFPGPIPRSSQQLTKLDRAIHRSKKVKFVYHGKEIEAEPYHLHYIAGEFYLVGGVEERKRSKVSKVSKVFRVSHIEGKVMYSTTAERDFKRPKGFDPTELFTGIDWQLGDPIGTARIWLADCVADEASTDFEAGVIAGRLNGGTMFDVPYSDNSRLKVWVESFGAHARRLLLTSEELDRHVAYKRVWEDVKPLKEVDEGGRIQPDALARLVTLAGILVKAGQDGSKLHLRELCGRLRISERELREDIKVLNVVNFGGGSYVLYAEIQGDQIEVDEQPYGDFFSNPMRLLPLEMRALLFVIDSVESYWAGPALASLREKIVRAMGSKLEKGLQVQPVKNPGVSKLEGVCSA